MKMAQIPNHISHSQLLTRIDQEAIWRNIVGPFKVGSNILNPFRVDKKPGSCKLDYYKERLVLMDWSTPRFNGTDCITAYLNLHPTKSWGEVVWDLLQGYTGSCNVKKPEKVEVHYEPIVRSWESRDKEYWKKRRISLDFLEEWGKIYPVKGFIKRKEKVKEFITSELIYCYEQNDKFKFYFPERSSYRFEGNQGRNDLWHHKMGSDTLLICKSHKDFLCTKSFNLCDLTHIQGESYGLPEGHKVLEWEIGYKNVLILFDNDKAGREGAERLKEMFLYLTPTILRLPFKTDYIKDTDDMLVQLGRKVSLNFFKNMLE